MDTMEDILADCNEVFRYDETRPQDRAHAYLKEHRVCRGYDDTAMERAAQDMIERAYAVGRMESSKAVTRETARIIAEGKPTCAECKRMVECCCDYGICEVEFDRAYAEEFGTGDSENSSFGAMWALEWISNHMRDMQEAACETFESY